MIYQHVKSGGYYQLLTNAIMEGSFEGKVDIVRHEKSGQMEVATTTFNVEEMSVYQSLTDYRVWTRPGKEFFDGRFVAVTYEQLERRRTLIYNNLLLFSRRLSSWAEEHHEELNHSIEQFANDLSIMDNAMNILLSAQVKAAFKQTPIVKEQSP